MTLPPHGGDKGRLLVLLHEDEAASDRMVEAIKPLIEEFKQFPAILHGRRESQNN